MALINEKILDHAEIDGNKIEIVQMEQLNGAQTGAMSQYMYFMKQVNAKLKFIRITLNNGEVTTESGAFYYSKGNIQNRVETGGVTGMIGKAIKGALTQEKAFNPVYSGTGTVVLEPTFGHYALVQLENEAIVVDKGLYYCSIGKIDVKPVMQKNISSAVAGGEGLFQTKIVGTGWVVLAIPVPMDELEIFTLNNERVQVDGNFALLRSDSIKFTVTGSAKGIVGTLTSGEGLLQTFEGTGMVWLAPTAPMYSRMMYGGMTAVNMTNGSRNNNQ